MDMGRKLTALKAQQDAGPKLAEWWIVKGKVTDPEAHDGLAFLGDTEWQFSDGPIGARGASQDFLNLEEGLAALSPAVFHFVP